MGLVEDADVWLKDYVQLIQERNELAIEFEEEWDKRKSEYDRLNSSNSDAIHIMGGIPGDPVSRTFDNIHVRFEKHLNSILTDMDSVDEKIKVCKMTIRAARLTRHERDIVEFHYLQMKQLKEIAEILRFSRQNITRIKEAMLLKLGDTLMRIDNRKQTDKQKEEKTPVA